MSMADDIMGEVAKNPGLTVREITVNIFRRRQPFQQMVRQECRHLVDAGRLERRGRGGYGDPFKYYIAHP
jgi:hypothetical protein